MSPGTARVLPGASVAQRYVVQRCLGRGELAEVYEARDGRSGAVLRLKLFFPEFSRDQAALSAFSRAAESAGALPSGVMAKHSDFGFDPQNLSAFAAGELVLGSSLADSGPLSVEALGLLLQNVAPALDQAHAAALVHRGLKPTNVFVSPDTSAVKITDFGIALLRAAAPPPPGWAATPGWLGPDAAEPRSPSTPAMDIYALGLLSFFVLTGKNPFRAMRDRVPDPQKLWLEMLEPIGSAKARAAELGGFLDGRLDAWFEKALAPHPRARFASVGEMSDAFRFALAPAKKQEAGRLPAVLAASGSEPESGRNPAAIASAQPLVFMRDLPPPAATQAELAPAANPQVSATPGAPHGARPAPAAAATYAASGRVGSNEGDALRPAGLPKRSILSLVVLSFVALMTLGALAAVGARFLFADSAEEAPSPKPAPSSPPSPQPAPPAASPAPAPSRAAQASALATASAAPPVEAKLAASAEVTRVADAAAPKIQPPPKPVPRVVRTSPKRAAPQTKPAPSPAPQKKCGTFINPCK